MFNDNSLSKRLGELNKQRQDVRNKVEALELCTAFAYSNVNLESLEQ